MRIPQAEDYIPHLAYDSVVFGFSANKLKILIMEYHNTGWYALPGGFVKREEDLDMAVRRGLRERTGLDQIYLEQFQTFGSRARHDPEVMRTIVEANGLQLPENHWLLGRFFSVAYYALINYEGVSLQPDLLADSIGWYPVDDLPPLILDHRLMVDRALDTLRRNLERKVVGVNLLPTRFTMKQLQQVFEAILGKKLRRSAFQRKLLSMEILERHEKHYNGKAHKAPYLYSFK